jgi:N-acyl amino acid synthase of PEP-CTERM/exosortase system
VNCAIARPLEARVIDDDPRVLEQSYRLRYQVYCIERAFLPAARYPEGLEIDEFDREAIHVGAIDNRGDLAGTARLVRPSAQGLPLFRHCSLFPDQAALREDATVVEVSRLAVSRQFAGGPIEKRSGTGQSRWSLTTSGPSGSDGHRGRGEVFLTLVKAVYQVSVRLGATHWLAATERSLQRMLVHEGFPFYAVGPVCDYFGPVAPYALNLRELTAVIASGRYPSLAACFEGLEPEFVRLPAEHPLQMTSIASAQPAEPEWAPLVRGT